MTDPTLPDNGALRRVESAKIDSYETYLKDKHRPPSRGGNGRAWHSHVIKIDGHTYSLLGLGFRKWAYKTDTVSFDRQWNEAMAHGDDGRASVPPRVEGLMKDGPMGKRPHSFDIESKVLDADDLVELVSPVFAEQNPDVVGAALAQLMAIFIASHGPPLREPSRKLLIDCADQLVPVVIEQLIEEGRVPPGWREKTDLQ